MTRDLRTVRALFSLWRLCISTLASARCLLVFPFFGGALVEGRPKSRTSKLLCNMETHDDEREVCSSFCILRAEESSMFYIASYLADEDAAKAVPFC